MSRTPQPEMITLSDSDSADTDDEESDAEEEEYELREEFDLDEEQLTDKVIRRMEKDFRVSEPLETMQEDSSVKLAAIVKHLRGGESWKESVRKIRRGQEDLEKQFHAACSSLTSYLDRRHGPYRVDELPKLAEIAPRPIPGNLEQELSKNRPPPSVADAPGSSSDRPLKRRKTEDESTESKDGRAATGRAGQYTETLIEDENGNFVPSRHATGIEHGLAAAFARAGDVGGAGAPPAAPFLPPQAPPAAPEHAFPQPPPPPRLPPQPLPPPLPPVHPLLPLVHPRLPPVQPPLPPVQPPLHPVQPPLPPVAPPPPPAPPVHPVPPAPPAPPPLPPPVVPPDNGGGASDEDCREEPEAARHADEYDAIDGAVQVAAGAQPYELYRTAEIEEIVERSTVSASNFPPALIVASTTQLPHGQLVTKTSRWNHVALHRPSSSLPHDLHSSVPASDRVVFNVISNADDAAETRVGHAANDNLRWRLFGRGTAGVVTLMLDGVEAGQGGARSWRGTVLLDDHVLDPTSLSSALVGLGWEEGWEYESTTAATARRRRTAFVGSLGPDRQPVSDQLVDAGHSFSPFLHAPLEGHPLLVAAAGTILEPDASSFTTPEGRPLRLDGRVHILAEPSTKGVPSTTLPNKNTMFWNGSNDSGWAEAPTDELVVARRGDPGGSGFLAATGYFSSDEKMRNAVSYLTAGKVEPQKVAEISIGPPKGTFSVSREVVHKTLGAQLRDGALQRASAEQRTIYALAFVARSDGATEIRALPTPALPAPALDYHEGSSGLFATRRYGATLSYDEQNRKLELAPGPRARRRLRLGYQEAEEGADKGVGSVAVAKRRRESSRFARVIADMESEDGYEVPLSTNPQQDLEFRLPGSTLLLRQVQKAVCNRPLAMHSGKSILARACKLQKISHIKLWRRDGKLRGGTRTADEAHPLSEFLEGSDRALAMLDVFQLELERLELSGVLRTASSNRMLEDAQGQRAEVRRLQEEILAKCASLLDTPTKAARAYCQNLRSEGVEMAMPIFLSDHLAISDGSHPAAFKDPDGDVTYGQWTVNSRPGKHWYRNNGVEDIFDAQQGALLIYFAELVPTVNGDSTVTMRFSGCMAVGGAIRRIQAPSTVDPVGIFALKALQRLKELVRAAATVPAGTSIRHGWLEKGGTRFKSSL